MCLRKGVPISDAKRNDSKCHTKIITNLSLYSGIGLVTGDVMMDLGMNGVVCLFFCMFVCLFVYLSCATSFNKYNERQKSAPLMGGLPYNMQKLVKPLWSFFSYQIKEMIEYLNAILS